jgi:molecular chaperone DnaK (HSP70)
MSVLGIDFGTSTSVFCGLANDRLDVLKDGEGEDIIPSMVG